MDFFWLVLPTLTSFHSWLEFFAVANKIKFFCWNWSMYWLFTSEWFFVIRNKSRVQIFRIEIDFVILFALDFVSITKDLNSATVLEPWILYQWKLGILYQWELGHSLHPNILNKVLCYGSLGHTHNLYNKTICLKASYARRNNYAFLAVIL